MNYTDHQKLIVPIRYWLLGLATVDSAYHEVLRVQSTLKQYVE